MLAFLKYLPVAIDVISVIAKLADLIKERLNLQEKKAQAIAKNQQTSVEDKGLLKVDTDLKAQQLKLISLAHNFLPKGAAKKASVEEVQKLIEKLTILVNLVVEILEVSASLTKE